MKKAQRDFRVNTLLFTRKSRSLLNKKKKVSLTDDKAAVTLFTFYFIRTDGDKHREEGAGSKHNEDHHDTHGHKGDKVQTLRSLAIDVQAVAIHVVVDDFFPLLLLVI